MIHRGQILFLSALLALLAALGLGLAALHLSRHEEEFRRNERRELLRAECRLLATQCVQHLDKLHRSLTELAAATPPDMRAVRERVATEPFFAAGFIARSNDGKLLYPDRSGSWFRRYEELFNGIIALPRDTEYRNVIMPREEADLYRRRQTRDDDSGILPAGADKLDSDLAQPAAGKRSAAGKIAPEVGYAREKFAVPSARSASAPQVMEPGKNSSARQSPSAKTEIPAGKMATGAAKPAAPARKLTPSSMAADAAAPAAFQIQAIKKETAPITAAQAQPGDGGAKRNGNRRMVTRFTALTTGRSSGFIPWFSDNDFTPLVWAQCSKTPDRIVGFELENTQLLARLLPLFPTHLPPYFRIELSDAGNRTIHAVGGTPVRDAEPVLVMPFPELLLPNAQLRAYLLEENLPLSSGGWGWALGLTALLLVLLGAGGLAAALTLRELRNARQKTTFVSRVSHELRTPLTGICLYSELLRDHPELPPEKSRRYLEQIKAESGRLNRLIGNVLDFGRLSDRRKHYHPEPTDLAALLEHARNVYAELAAQIGVELAFEASREAFTATIDRDSLLQVLYNLFDNALKYAPEGRKIAVSIGREDRRTVIHVRDYGPGIPARLRRKVFREFYRVDDRLCAATGGCGLGLAIARTLLCDQGGDLELRNAKPGCDFVIVLPGDQKS